MSAFLKLTSKGTWRQVFICLRSPLPPCYTLYEYTPGWRGGGGRWTSEKFRGALVHKSGRKYQHNWLYLQSINSIRHQWRRHLRFGVFTEFGPWFLHMNFWQISLFWRRRRCMHTQFCKFQPEFPGFFTGRKKARQKNLWCAHMRATNMGGLQLPSATQHAPVCFIS